MLERWKGFQSVEFVGQWIDGYIEVSSIRARKEWGSGRRHHTFSLLKRIACEGDVIFWAGFSSIPLHQISQSTMEADFRDCFNPLHYYDIYDGMCQDQLSPNTICLVRTTARVIYYIWNWFLMCYYSKQFFFYI